MIPEAPLEQTAFGLARGGEGWFVLNAKEARWRYREDRGEALRFAGDGDFPQIGINLFVLGPGEPIGMYHHEADQENFLVLAGEALLLIEGEERPLRQWDFVHCPAEAAHMILGAGDGGVVLAVGAREHQNREGWGAYTVDEVALRHGAGVEEETPTPTRRTPGSRSPSRRGTATAGCPANSAAGAGYPLAEWNSAPDRTPLSARQEEILARVVEGYVATRLAGRLEDARRARRDRGVLVHRPERAGRARGARAPHAPAHVGRPGADRRRLPHLRRPRARPAASRAPRRASSSTCPRRRARSTRRCGDDRRARPAHAPPRARLGARASRRRSSATSR